MRKAVLNVSIFVVGFLIAVLVVYKTNFSFFSANKKLRTHTQVVPVVEKPHQAKPVEPIADTLALTQNTLTAHSTSETNKTSLDSKQPQKLPPGRSDHPQPTKAKPLEELLSAVRSGTPEDLADIRSDIVTQIPDFAHSVLPALKRESLETLINKFSPHDWTAWTKASLNSTGRQSTARLYVDDVTTVNPELGTFLETSAQLLHALYQNVQAGLGYDLSKGMPEILTNAEKLLANRKKAAVPARYMLSAETIHELVFLSIFERVRGNLVSRFILEHPKDLKAHFTLIRTLDPKACDPTVDKAISQAIYRLALEGSAQFREQILLKELEKPALREFVEIRPENRVKRALANLYLVAAVDALVELHDKLQARRFLQESLTLESGLEAQKTVEKYLSTDDVPQDTSTHISSAESSRHQQVTPAQPVTATREEQDTPWIFLAISFAVLCSLPLGALALRRYVTMRRAMLLHQQELNQLVSIDNDEQDLTTENPPAAEAEIAQTATDTEIDIEEPKPRVVGEN